MTGVNFAVLVGNVGADPEVNTTSSGQPVARFRIATGESWKDRATGEKRERTEWHTVVVWSEGLVGVVEKFVRKGSRLFVRGAIRTREWEGNDGVKRWTTEIHLSGFDAQLVLLDKANGAGRPPAPDEDPSPRAQASRMISEGHAPQPAAHPDLDDEIPF